jgi:hypothetical protein
VSTTQIDDPEDANPADDLEFDVPKRRFCTKQNVTVKECDTVIEPMENVLQKESTGEPPDTILVSLKNLKPKKNLICIKRGVKKMSR